MYLVSDINVYISEDEDFGILLQALERTSSRFMYMYMYTEGWYSMYCFAVCEEKAALSPKDEMPKLMCIITGQSAHWVSGVIGYIYLLFYLSKLMSIVLYSLVIFVVSTIVYIIIYI